MTKMDKHTAEKVLGLTGTYDFKTFTKAYRAAVKDNHPDTGGSEEKMVEVNAAHDYLKTYFEDKNATVKASSGATTQTKKGATSTPKTAKAASHAAHATHAATDDYVADFVKNAAASAYATNGSEKDAPFTDSDYTEKPQSAWTSFDWEAFKNFQPTRTYDTTEFAVEKMKSWKAYGAHIAEAGNIDTSDWHDSDWYFYWFVNARNPRPDGKVYTHFKAVPLYGPYAEKFRAKKSATYRADAKAYHDITQEWVNTPYGRVDASNLERFGWVGNVGVPWVYALTEDYEDWLAMNLAAQKEATKFYGGKAKHLVAEDYGWMGDEFYKNAHTTTDQKTAKKTTFDVGFEDTWSTKEKAGAKVETDATAPAWYNAMVNIAEHFPARIIYWVVSMMYGCAILSSSPTGGELIFCSFLALLAFVNVVVPIFGFVPGVLRFVAKTALTGWKAKSGKSRVGV